jgi:hypothetical protein
MAKFLNKKEQVFDLKLTSYGNYRLSQGNFKPVYYAFYDDNILYDIQYASGKNGSGEFVISPKELQNDIQRRIKDETQYIESFVLFDEIENQATTMTEQLRENQVGTENNGYWERQETGWDGDAQKAIYEQVYVGPTEYGYSGVFSADYNPTQEEPRKDFFKFNSMIGDAYLDGDTQAAPAWKIITLQGQINSSATEDLKNRTKIPQINIDLKYVKEINDFDFANVADPESIQQLAASTQQFNDKKVISLKLDDVVVYAEELNTELLTENFEIEVFEIAESTWVHASGSVELNYGETIADSTTVTINGGTSAYEFTFVTAEPASDAYLEVWIDPEGGPDNTMYNFKKKIEDHPEAQKELTAELVESPQNGRRIRVEIENKKTGPMYNIPIGTSNATIFSVEGFAGGFDGNDVLKRKFFERQIPQVKNGMMLSERPKETDVASLTSASVEYYFDILTDYNINQTIACKGAEIYNKESYYIDLDFDCDQDAQDFVYNDIYGYVTEPEVCLD